MQNIYAYNLITILNCAKIKALRPHLKETSFFYDVPFDELDPLQLEDVIKVAGLYPLPFFSLKTTDKKCYLEESMNIKHLWQSVHLANPHHTLTVASTLQGAHLYTDFCLTNKHWELLKSKCRSAISVVYNTFKNPIKTIDYPPPRLKRPIK